MSASDEQPDELLDEPVEYPLPEPQPATPVEAQVLEVIDGPTLRHGKWWVRVLAVYASGEFETVLSFVDQAEAELVGPGTQFLA